MNRMGRIRIASKPAGSSTSLISGTVGAGLTVGYRENFRKVGDVQKKISIQRSEVGGARRSVLSLQAHGYIF